MLWNLCQHRLNFVPSLFFNKQGGAGGQRAALARFPSQNFMFIERIGTLVDGG
jgi:hypothetical protein